VNKFPTLDIKKFFKSSKADRIKYGKEVDLICQETGFLIIKNHGVSSDVIKNLWNCAENFFSFEYEEKLKSKVPYKGYPYGYLGPGKEALAASKGIKTPPDLKESFNGGPLKRPKNITDSDALTFCYADTIWPNKPKDFRIYWRAYYLEMEKLAARIMKIFACALRLEHNFFDQYIDNPISALRAINYPEQQTPPEDKQLRAGAHSDYGSLTILLPQEDSTGLEILSRTGDWCPIPVIPNTFIINIGDLMAMWTNDRWVSTLHRVVNSDSTRKRQSFAYFHQPNWFAEIECLPSCLNPGEKPIYPNTYSGPYLMNKFKSTAQ
tara:strand:+ start:199 stop:1164 length:966 start_codon:yes stop_codon:yes gene_type:complete